MIVGQIIGLNRRFNAHAIIRPLTFALLLMLLAIVMAASMSSTASNTLTATRAFTFLNSIGVNTHLGWWDTAWGVGGGSWAGAETKVLAELRYLNVTNIRDSVPEVAVQSEVTDLAKDGYTFDLLQNVDSGQVALQSDIARLTALETAAPNSIMAYEGANEYNSNSYTLNGQNSSGNLAWGAADDQASLAALRSQSSLAGVSFIAASTASVSAAPVVTSYVNDSNWHVYAGVGVQLKSNLASGIQAAAATAIGKPVFITETGISSAATAQATYGTVGDEYTQGLIDTNALLDASHDGAAKTFLYDLMDNNQAADLEDNFGLFNADGTAKAAATDIHNLTSILADSGATAATFARTPMSLSIAGLPTTGSDMLLQKSSGINELVLWNSGASVWNTSTNSEATPVSSTVTVTLDGIHQTVNIYDPLVSSSPIQTLTDVSSVSVGLSKDPLIIETSAGTVPAIPAPTKLGSGPSTLALQMSEDAWQGDAQFTVSVDGIQVGGTQTVVASHAAGLTQEFDVSGNWATGIHQVSVDFINDAWGGSATTDRNLYDNSASFNGTTVLSRPIAQDNDGPSTFNFVRGDQLDLFVNEDAWMGNAQFTVSVDGVQVGGVDTATASHSSGTSQELALFGIWGSGAHTVSINFTNDAYGGTAAMDRNLYLTGASYDGTSISAASKIFMTSGAQSFAIPATSSSASALAVSAVNSLSSMQFISGSAVSTAASSAVPTAAGTKISVTAADLTLSSYAPVVGAPPSSSDTQAGTSLEQIGSASISSLVTDPTPISPLHLATTETRAFS